MELGKLMFSLVLLITFSLVLLITLLSLYFIHLWSCISVNCLFPMLTYNYIMCFRRKNCLAGCHTISLWRFDVYLCVPMDSRIESKWRRDSTWFYFCNIHVIFDVGKLTGIQVDGSFITPSRGLHADCFCNFCCIFTSSHSEHCMLDSPTLSLVWLFASHTILL